MRLRFSIGFAAAILPAMLFAQTTPSNDAEQTVHEKITTIRETETRTVERHRENGVRTAAIIVKNHASNVNDDKVAALEDMIAARVTDRGFRIISRDDVLNAVSSGASEGANQGTSQTNKLDQLLSDNTSALRLAQNLDADYILVASIDTYGNDEIEYTGDGIHTLINDSKMQVSYKLLDAGAGGSLTGGVIDADQKDRVQPGVTIKHDMVNGLLSDASVKLADALGTKAEQNRIREAPKADASTVQFTVNTSMGDLTVPEVTKSPSGEYIVTANRYTVEAMNVTVALDGITLGTTPGPFVASQGLHKILLTRQGFKDWQQTINIRNGLTLNVALQMDDAGYSRWRDSASFLEGLKINSKMTDAQVKAWEGFAKMLSQSDMHIIQQNVNINGGGYYGGSGFYPAPVIISPTTLPFRPDMEHMNP